MSNKTAMMQLRDKCIEQAKELRLQPLFNTYNAAYADALESVVKDIDAKMLSIENQQMIDIWNSSREKKSECSNWNCSGDEKTYDNFKQYFNETFNQ